jgi:hypothetical protein
MANPGKRDHESRMSPTGQVSSMYVQVSVPSRGSASYASPTPREMRESWGEEKAA